jgi:hypothetical protein
MINDNEWCMVENVGVYITFLILFTLWLYIKDRDDL